MNVETRILFADGERAARDGDSSTARACFLQAADSAIQVQLWRSAVRCYRHALELDLCDRAIVEKVLAVPARVISGRGWEEYRRALDTHAWPHFGCRSSRIVLGDDGAVIECNGRGSVLELMMTERDLVELRAESRFAGMPMAMALIILRRAMWPSPRERDEPMSIRVIFELRDRVRLDELGDWEPLVGER